MRHSQVELKTRNSHLAVSIFIDVDAFEYKHMVASELKALDVPAQTIAEGFVRSNIVAENNHLSHISCAQNTAVGLSTPSSSLADFVATWCMIAHEILEGIISDGGEMSNSDKFYIARKIVGEAVRLRTREKPQTTPLNVWKFSMRTINL